MPNRSFMLLSAVLAGCAVVSLYLVAHDAFGFSRHLIAIGSFGSAAALAVACVFAPRAQR
jgi:hypothetical protein